MTIVRFAQEPPPNSRRSSIVRGALQAGAVRFAADLANCPSASLDQLVRCYGNRQPAKVGLARNRGRRLSNEWSVIIFNIGRLTSGSETEFGIALRQFGKALHVAVDPSLFRRWQFLVALLRWFC